MAVSVGADIESVCGKCGDVWHVVVAMVGNNVVKVVCKQCGNQHGYRPKGGKAKSKSSSRSTSATKKSSTRSMSKSNEPLVPANMDKDVQRYTISTQFNVGDRIEHKKFGLGVVEMELPDKKIQVFFYEGRRVLVHAR